MFSSISIKSRYIIELRLLFNILLYRILFLKFDNIYQEIIKAKHLFDYITLFIFRSIADLAANPFMILL